MKHFLTSLITLVSTLSLFSQPTIVSTNPENKKVVLEEFTGTNCHYCPYGHLISNQIMDANPEKVFAINIHTGSYAPTYPASIDYTTAYGNSIATQAGASSMGYPCGTINRHLYTGSVLAMGRGSWGTYTGQALIQSSPANLAINVDLDYLTRQLTVLVEVYYTATSSASTNKLNVAILQDWVKGPQVNADGNPDYITPDGQYFHMHMLRNLITGQWGATIPTTTMGSFWDSTFVFTVPNSYGSIPVELRNLKVVAFVAEGQTDILTADEANAPKAPVDATITSVNGIPSVLCDPSFIPAVIVKNEGANTITSFNIDYSINSGTTSTYSWTGFLVSDSSVIVTLPQLSISTLGSHTFEASTSNPNSSADYNTSNDSYSHSFELLDEGTLPISQDFTSTLFPPADFVIVDCGDDGKFWARNISGHIAAGSAYIKWYNISNGQIDDLMISPLDFSASGSMNLSFFVAHRQYNSSNDKLQVDVSADCGTTWTTEWSKSGSSLATGSVMTSEFVSPTVGEWRQEIIDLSSYGGQSNILIRFRSTSNYGNNLFLDEINISPNVSLNEELNTFINLYPNPAKEYVTCEINATSAEEVKIIVVNSIGAVVYSSLEWITPGFNSVSINTNSFVNGLYFLHFQTPSNLSITSFAVEK